MQFQQLLVTTYFILLFYFALDSMTSITNEFVKLFSFRQYYNFYATILTIDWCLWGQLFAGNLLSLPKVGKFHKFGVPAKPSSDI